MGNYKTAVITAKGLEYIARAQAGEALIFSHMAISDYAYPAGTDLSNLTALQSVKMIVEPASVWVQDTTVGVRGMFSNAAVTTAYNIQTVGVYATISGTEILFSVSSAITPDEMPVYNGVAPSSFIFTVQETIGEASSLNITVSTTGTATAQDIADLQAGKQDTITGAASTITDAPLTASRALASNASGKVAVSSVTTTELGRLSGVTGNVQEQLNGKQATITGAASTIASANLTASRALVSTSSQKVGVSATTATELGYVHGVTSAIQTQLDALKRHVVTTAGTNLNDYLTTGIYFFSTDYTPTNIPDGTNGILIVYSMQTAETATTQCKQLWLRQGTPGTNSYQMWERTRNTSGWGAWVRYLTTADDLAPGAASSILTSKLTTNRALISNGSGNVGVSATTATELGYVHGVTSAIQTQINGKAPTDHASSGTSYGVGSSTNFGHVKVADNLSTSSFDSTAPVVLSAYRGKLLNDALTATNQTTVGFSSNFNETTIAAGNRVNIQWSDEINNNYFRRQTGGSVTFKTAGTYLIMVKASIAKSAASNSYAEAVLQYRDWDSSTNAWSTTYNEMGNFVGGQSNLVFGTVTDFYILSITAGNAKMFNLYAKDFGIKVNGVKMAIIKLS